MILKDNKMQNLGIDNAWSDQKVYKRYKKHTDLVNSPMNIKDLEDYGSGEREKSPKPYMGSLERLGNRHISSFLAKKTAARGTIIKDGTKALPTDYLSSNARNMPFSQRPTSLSIFPHIGMISNKETYTT